MKKTIASAGRKLLGKIPYVAALREQVARQGTYPAGHFYSPIPSEDEVRAYLRDGPSTTCDAIDLHENAQFEALKQFSEYYAELPFPDEPDDSCRYYYNQNMFCPADAIYLYSFLRHYRPPRIVEVGSGYSSAVMLDTVERFLDQPPSMTFIEPRPKRLRKLLRPADYEYVTLIEDKVQTGWAKVPGELAAGDLLFIDSSHVVKCGSDLQFLLFEVLPTLPPGVFVHVHDIFYPFEYPRDWLLHGRYWNELYMLRAFLSFNESWSIEFFNSFVGVRFAEFLREKMPLCLKKTGGSIYLRRTR